MSILVQVPKDVVFISLHGLKGGVWLFSFITFFFINVFVVFSVQRVLEQRVTAVLDKLLVKPSLVKLPSMEEGGLLLVSIIFTSCLHYYHPSAA